MDWHWFRTAFNRIVGFLPDLIGGLVVLAIGLIIATLAARVARPLLHRIGFDRFLARLGVVEAGAETTRGSGWAASAIYWVIVLVTATQVARSWRLDSVAAGLSKVTAYLPHVLAAAAIMAAALFVGNWVKSRMLAAEIESHERRIAAGAVRAGILAVGAFMALRELQVAPQIVTIAFTLTLGAIAFAAALAFGLGSRPVAEQLTREWYENGGRAARRRAAAPPPRRADEDRGVEVEVKRDA